MNRTVSLLFYCGRASGTVTGDVAFNVTANFSEADTEVGDSCSGFSQVRSLWLTSLKITTDKGVYIKKVKLTVGTEENTNVTTVYQRTGMNTYGTSFSIFSGNYFFQNNDTNELANLKCVQIIITFAFSNGGSECAVILEGEVTTGAWNNGTRPVAAALKASYRW